MTAPVFADEGLEKLCAGWLLGARVPQIAAVVPRLHDGLFTFGPARALAASARANMAAGEAIDIATLAGDLRGTVHATSASVLAQWHVEYDALLTPITSILDGLEDLERQRVARTIRHLPAESTGAGSLATIAAAVQSAPTPGGVEIVTAFDGVLDVLREFESPQTTRILTGIGALDGLTGGFQPGDLVIVGARTSAGKSVMGLRLARGVWHTQRRPVLFHSLEMGRSQLIRRCIADEAQVDNWRVQRAAWSHDGEQERVYQAAKVVAEWRGLHILDANLPFPDAVAVYEQWAAQQQAPGMLVVDYIGLVRGVPGVERRYQELGIITHTLKALARRLKMVVVAVSQLNRQSATSLAPPQLHELRESGDLEQDADCVLLLHTPKADDGLDWQPLEVIVAKHRSGSLGTVTLDFTRRFCRIEDAA